MSLNPEGPSDNESTILDVVEIALREEDYIDLGNNAGEDAEYRSLALRLVQSLAFRRFGIQRLAEDED